MCIACYTFHDFPAWILSLGALMKSQHREGDVSLILQTRKLRLRRWTQQSSMWGRIRKRDFPPPAVSSPRWTVRDYTTKIPNIRENVESQGCVQSIFLLCTIIVGLKINTMGKAFITASDRNESTVNAIYLFCEQLFSQHFYNNKTNRNNINV